MPAILVLVLGLVAAAWTGLRQASANDARIDAALAVAADRAAEDLTARFRLYQYGLRGARGAVIGGAGTSRAQFRRYAESRDIALEFPGARGFGYIERVPQAREAEFVRAARADGAPDFTVRQLAPHVGERQVIKYLEPEASNAAAIGLDIASEVVRREAALAAMLTGEATLTAPITLVQSTGQAKRAMLFLFPVYEGNQTRPAATREAACIGWVYAPLVTDDILDGFEQANATYGFTLTDLGSSARIFSSGQEGSSDALEHFRDFGVYGRTWRVTVAARPAFRASLGLPDPRRTALLIALASLPLALAAYLLMVSAQRRRSADNARRRLAAIVESSQDAIIGTTLDGRVTEWNRAAVRMFGYEAADAIGRTKVELIIPYDRAGEDLHLLAQVAAGRDANQIETVRRRSDGSLLDVELSASPIRDSSGRVTGAAAVLRDISERRRTETTMRHVAANLEREVEQRTRQLQATSALQRAILAHAGYSIIATDPIGTITLFNPAAEAMLGYTAAQVVGRDSPAIFHDPVEVAVRAHDLQQALGRPLSSGFEVFTASALREPDVREWTYLTRSGARIPVLLNVSALRDADGAITGFLGIAVDLREQKRRDAAIETNERKLRGLFELSPLGIALTDGAGRFVEFNEAFRALTGYDEAALLALDYWTLTPREYEPDERALLRSLERTGRYGPYEKQYVRKDGSRIPIRLNGVGLQIAGEPHIWSIVEDITGQRIAEAAMVDAVAAAEAASKSKSDFLANMSHEIRTPMNAILGMLQLLQRSPLDARQADYATKTETAARTLLAILNDILDFSKIEAGRQTLEAQVFDVERLLRDVSVILGGNVGDKDIEVVFDIDPQLPPQLVGDVLRLQQVLINLAGNAIKFTQVGEVVLAIRLGEHDDERVLVEFEVRDTGIGIDASKLETIFEGFSQAEASTTRRFGGTGLGLAISQRLVRLMGGEVRVESERGRGSRFHFRLPFTLAGVSGPPPQDALPTTLRALVVDDHASARHAMVEMMATRGWTAVTADSGEAALALLAEDTVGFDVVFLDWQMPGLDGWETGRRIRAVRGDGAHAPLIIMVTAHGREVLAERAATDATLLDGFLVKPVTLSMLADSVADARSALAGSAATALPRQAPRERRLPGMVVLVVDDNANNQQVVSELLQDEGARILVAGGGAEALRHVGSVGHGIDVVLMDIQMPDMDGYTVTRRMRAMPHLAGLPIIAMTANVLPADREACLAAGMNDHLGKPFDLDTLVDRLRRWTGRGGAADAAVGAVDPDARRAAVQSRQAPAVLDVDAALARFGGNARVYARALQRFVGDSGALLDGVARLLQGGRAADAARELHTLKGIAGTVGAARLAQVAGVSETLALGGGAAEAVLAPLRQAVHDAVSAAGEAHGAMTDTSPVSASDTGVAPVGDDAIDALASLLSASNLEALDVFAGLQAAIAQRDPAVETEISAALDAFDFAAALAACRRLVSTTPSSQGDAT